MAYLILMGAVFLMALFFLGEGILHLREVTGPWTVDPHDYDDRWKKTHRP